MIVKIRVDISPPAGLSKDKLYNVLAMSFFPDGRVECRVCTDDDRLPALYPLDIFIIIDGDICKDWCIYCKLSGGIELCPKNWAEPDFWTRFFDGEERAVNMFRTYLETLDDQSNYGSPILN